MKRAAQKAANEEQRQRKLTPREAAVALNAALEKHYKELHGVPDKQAVSSLLAVARGLESSLNVTAEFRGFILAASAAHEAALQKLRALKFVAREANVGRTAAHCTGKTWRGDAAKVAALIAAWVGEHGSLLASIRLDLAEHRAPHLAG